MAIKDQITITTKDDQNNPLIKGLFSQISLKGNRYEVQDTAARDAIDTMAESTVTNVSWNGGNIQKTINGTTTNVVTASTIVTSGINTDSAKPTVTVDSHSEILRTFGAIKVADVKSVTPTLESYAYVDSGDSSVKYYGLQIDQNGLAFIQTPTFLTEHQSLTNYYTKSNVDGLISGIRGTSSDAASAETIAGAKKYAADAVAALAQTVEDTYAGLDSTTLATINQIKDELEDPDSDMESFLDDVKIALGTLNTGLSGTVKDVQYVYNNSSSSYELQYTTDDGESPTWSTIVNAQDIVSNGLQIATGETLGGIKGTSYESTVDFSHNDRYYGVIIDQNGLAYVNVPWTDTHVTAASTTTLGGIKLYSAKGSTAIEPQTASTVANRYYEVQLDTNNKAFVNVPWTDTLYTLPQATSSVLGGIKLSYVDNSDYTNYISLGGHVTDIFVSGSSNVYQNYGLQKGTDDNVFVNVPWTETTVQYNTTNKTIDATIRSAGANGPELTTTSISASTIVTDGDGLKKSEMKVENQILYLG